MQPWSYELAGRLDEHAFESTRLEGNPLGDPHVRPLWVYLPPGYDDDPERRYPSIYVIQGLTGQLDMWRNRTPFARTSRSWPTSCSRAAGRRPASSSRSTAGRRSAAASSSTRRARAGTTPISATRSSRSSTRATARSPRRRTAASRASRAAATARWSTPMLRPDVFGGLATHAGDALFEMCYLPDFRESVRALRDHYDGSFERFWEDFRGRPGVHEGGDGTLLNDWCMAACYSADDDGTVRLPSTPPPASCGPTSGSAGSRGTRCGWSRATPTRCARCGRSASMRGTATSSSSTSAPRRSGASWRRSASRTSTSSSSTATHVGDRVPLPARDQVPGGTPVVTDTAGPTRRRTVTGLRRGEWIQLGLAALAVAAAALAHFARRTPVLAFAVAAIAIAFLAHLVGGATEQLGRRVGSSAAGVVQSGARQPAGALHLAVRAAAKGSSASCSRRSSARSSRTACSCSGIAFLVGGIRNGTQRFDSPRARMIATLTTLGRGDPLRADARARVPRAGRGRTAAR